MKENRALLLLTSAGMDLSWLYAWTTFVTVSVLHRSFPYPEAVGSFALDQDRVRIAGADMRKLFRTGASGAYL